MKKYRKKPDIFEAVRFVGPESLEGLNPKPTHLMLNNRWCAKIHTIEGTMTANEGDWIIRGIKGELYPCKPDIFEATYEAI